MLFSKLEILSVLRLFLVSKYLTLELCSLKTIENLMMVPKAKLEISHNSTTFTNTNFANSNWIRINRGMK